MINQIKTKFSDPDFKDLVVTNVVAIIAGILISGIMLLLIKINPIEAFSVATASVMSDKYTFAEILVKATPLIFTGLAFAFTYKANLFNIGAQGQFYIGTIVAVAISLSIGDVVPGFIGIIVVMALTIVAGAIYGGLIGLVKAKKGANEFLISMMSTYVAIAFMNFLLRTSLRETRGEYPQTDVIPESMRLPIIWGGTRLHLGFILAVLTAVTLWLILFKTPFGFRVRAVGNNASAAVQAGINSSKTTIITFAISGAMGALAGFLVVNGIQYMVIQGYYAEVGALGIGIAILANGNPIGVIFAALLFGGIQVIGIEMTMRAKTPTSFTYLMLGCVTLFVIISYYFRRVMKINRDKKKLVDGVSK
ncbi:ABC transporter permease [Mycoplasmatota bacterium]|nr:ABC transporter permease [Mycoplasmatota bacterium]